MQTQRETKQWIRAVAEFLGVSTSELARRAGLSPSTLTRYLNSVDGGLGISQKSLDAIAAYSGVSPHRFPGRGSGFAEADAEPFEVPEQTTTGFDKAVRALVEDGEDRVACVTKGWSLNLLGYLPGDVVIVDLNRQPQAGDVVWADVRDWSDGKAEAVMRIYEPPFLLSATSREAPGKPLVVDNERVVIKGVVRALLRPPKAD